jgi:hypothetical protein
MIAVVGGVGISGTRGRDGAGGLLRTGKGESHSSGMANGGCWRLGKPAEDFSEAQNGAEAGQASKFVPHHQPANGFSAPTGASPMELRVELLLKPAPMDSSEQSEQRPDSEE